MSTSVNDPSMEASGWSRRALLKMAGLGGAMAAMPAIHAAGVAGSPDKEWVFNVLKFGAVGDGKHDDTAAVQAAVLAAEKVGGTVVFPPAAKYLLGDIKITRPVKIEGAGGKIPVIAKSSTTVLFHISSNTVYLSNFHVDMSAAKANAVVVFIDSAKERLRDIFLSLLFVEGCYAFLRDANGKGQIVNLHLDNIYCRNNRGATIHLTNAFGYIYFTNVTVDNVPEANKGTPIDFSGIIIENVQGIILDKCDVTGGNGHIDNNGFLFKKCEVIHLHNCMADYSGGVGYRFEQTWYIYFDTVVASLCSHGSVLMDNCRFVHGVNMINVGRRELPTFRVAQAHGIRAIKTHDMTFSGIHARGHTGNGLQLEGCSHSAWSAVHIFYNDGAGIVEDDMHQPGAGGNLFTGCVLGENQSGNYRLASSRSYICQTILDSGLFQASQNGPSSG